MYIKILFLLISITGKLDSTGIQDRELFEQNQDKDLFMRKINTKHENVRKIKVKKINTKHQKYQKYEQSENKNIIIMLISVYIIFLLIRITC